MTDDKTGRSIGLRAHIAQSIKNILFTRIGTRVMREDYGSLLPELIDMPMTPAVIAVSHQAIVTALATWEPRIKISQIQFDVQAAAEGRLKVAIHTALEDGTEQIFKIE